MEIKAQRNENTFLILAFYNQVFFVTRSDIYTSLARCNVQSTIMHCVLHSIIDGNPDQLCLKNAILLPNGDTKKAANANKFKVNWPL